MNSDESDKSRSQGYKRGRLPNSARKLDELKRKYLTYLDTNAKISESKMKVLELLASDMEK